jgi:hypothetical protein
MNRTASFIVIALLALGTATAAPATVVVTNVSEAGEFSFNVAQNAGLGTGFAFVTSLSGVKVTSLGIYQPIPGDYGGNMVTDNTVNTQVVLAHVDTGGATATVIAQATVNVNDLTNPLDAQRFQYATLSNPVTLIQGDTYLLLNNDPFPNWELNNSGFVNITLATGFTHPGAAASFTGPGSEWSNGTIAVGDTIGSSVFAGASNTYGPTNFQFEVPEPVTIGLLLIGSLGLLRRRARQAA